MARTAWPAAWPLVPAAVRRLLNPDAGALLPALRAEMFGAERFARHGHSLGLTHRAGPASGPDAGFFPRLRQNIQALHAARHYLAAQATLGRDIGPAGDWLLDNFHLVEAQIPAIRAGLPRSYFRGLPVLLDEPLAGLPRVYGVAWAFVAHTDSAFDEPLLVGFLQAYQSSRALNLGELWALPTTLRVVLIENLRRLAEHAATHKAARELAMLCSEQLERCPPPVLQALYARLERRGVALAFLVRLSQSAIDWPDTPQHTAALHWLRDMLPAPAVAQNQLDADQAADNLSVGNVVGALRALGDADWPELIGQASALMRCLWADPVFAAEHTLSRDQTLQGIERLARRSGRPELEVAQTLLAHMQAAPSHTPAQLAGHWLDGPGRTVLLPALGLPAGLSPRFQALLLGMRLPAYLATLALGTWAALVMLWPALGTHGEPLGLRWGLALLLAWPVSEAVSALFNRLLAESLRPRRLPRLALPEGIDAAHRVLVAVPALLSNSATVDALLHRLHLHHLANPEPQAQFALLSDFTDAPTEHQPGDTALLAYALAGLARLNAQHPGLAPGVPRFVLLHRPRRYSVSEQAWIGHERKRGKLMALVATLHDPLARSAFEPLGERGEASRLAHPIPLLLTLDADTQLPPGRLRELVGVAAHPAHTPRLSADGLRVQSGHGVLQPRLVAPLPTHAERTVFHRLQAGECGMDPYSAASSEVYQDVFDEGSFTGKGLIQVAAMHAVLAGRLPEEQVLSHDLLEGSLLRCATVSDVCLVEAAPSQAGVAQARQHRWMRGDWQLWPFLYGPAARGLSALHRWKLLDNLRRSLVAPAGWVLLLLSLAGVGLPLPWALAVVLAAVLTGPLLGALAALAPGLSLGRSDMARGHFLVHAGTNLLWTLLAGAWTLSQWQAQALEALDAIGRAVWRQSVSRRHLLQWTTMATTQARPHTGWWAQCWQHRAEMRLALLMALGGVWLPASWSMLGLGLCLLWAAAPLVRAMASQAPATTAGHMLAPEERAWFEDLARDTWRWFERCISADDGHLPPDNLQLAPLEALAHRTSPTNIGLYLLSVACARQMGWIGTQELLNRLGATLASLERLERHRGHFLNWYDTRTGAALLPAYVSTVDSGNLSGHLLAVAAACRELAAAPDGRNATHRALMAGAVRLATCMHAWRHLVPAATDVHSVPGWAVLRKLADGHQAIALLIEPLAHAHALVEQAIDGLPDLHVHPAVHESGGPSAREQLRWCALDQLNTLASARLDIGAHATVLTPRLLALAGALEALAWAPQWGFLYHPRRHLLHIGWRVAEQTLDTAFYDLLASESRLTSLVAIAKGELPARHWAALGRPCQVMGWRTALRSWSGSMFEYLMPGLVMAEPPGSLLDGAARAAVAEQIRAGRAQSRPWGRSESAHAGRDHTLAYQYAPQGEPRLALRRNDGDDWVVAPYATALAAPLAPRRAHRNFARLAALGTRGRYGFMEALDGSPCQRQPGQGATPVFAFMAHHQGMSLVALTNLLADQVAQRWGQAHPRMEAVALLLHERAPRRVARLPSPVAVRQPVAGAGAHRPSRHLRPGADAVPPTHLLSNGHHSVGLRPQGGGFSRCGEAHLHRWRDDVLRDHWGSFILLRRGETGRLVSLTQLPMPDEQAHYHARFEADRVVFDTHWPDLHSQTTVWVSPEDDIEFREVLLRNLGPEPLRLTLNSLFEPTLATAQADEAHPAFSNLFLRLHWLPAQQALWLHRLPHLTGENARLVAHFLTEAPEGGHALLGQASRVQWQGRNQGPSAPMGVLAPLPGPHSPDPTELHALDTGMDAVCALGLSLTLPPGASVRLTWATAWALQPEPLLALLDKYRQPAHVQRAQALSATLAGIRWRGPGQRHDELAALQDLSTALLLTLSRLAPLPRLSQLLPDPLAPCDRALLWRFGLSGDRPLILVNLASTDGLGLVRSLARLLGHWAWAGVGGDVVLVNHEPHSYQMPLHHALAALCERHRAELARTGPQGTGMVLLHRQDLGLAELAVLDHLACARLLADGRPLSQAVAEWLAPHETAWQARQSQPARVLAEMPAPQGPLHTSQGSFDTTSGEFSFPVHAGMRPARPWALVLANPQFGALHTEAGGGNTWAGNSRLHQLTAWANDPVADPPGEWWLLHDVASGACWSVSPSAWGDRNVSYRVSHRPGGSVIQHQRGALTVCASWCVDPVLAIKQVRLELHNHGATPMHLEVLGLVEWLLGSQRRHRATVHTQMREWSLPDAAGHAQPWHVLLATQHSTESGPSGGTAFLALLPASMRTDTAVTWSCDRRAFFSPEGHLQWPQPLDSVATPWADPCAALACTWVLAPGEPQTCCFLLGHAAQPDAACELARRVVEVSPQARWADVQRVWQEPLDRIQVHTPDPLFDVLVNRWLIYQTLACRLWAKAGFYQAGGATGFRDQLQDAMALSWIAPELLRQQIIDSAAHQFEEGDVQHWWHAPLGLGARTRFSDDLLWLPLALLHYLHTTGDQSLLEQPVGFLRAPALPDGAEDRCDIPAPSDEIASVYEHAARTLDIRLAVGAHGLPLMGSGDWNDSMNRIGHEGRGESVWLGWFLSPLVRDMAPVARQRGQAERAQRWEQAAQGWHEALRTHAWDGAWFRRAWFDDGQVLGSKDNSEARIDLIAQAWSVLSEVAPLAQQQAAMHAVQQHLVDGSAGLIRLLTPPLQHSWPQPGYICAYPPGVRENGGQYNHAAIWALMAMVQVATRQGVPDAVVAERAWAQFRWISPAHRSTHAQQGAAYELEPYVVAGDVCSQPPWTGRGGWSWYTGAAGWLHRAATGTLFGLEMQASTLCLRPCLPPHWPRAELRLRRPGCDLRFIFLQATPAEAQAITQPEQARLLLPGQALAWPNLPLGTCFVVPLGSALQQARSEGNNR